MQFRSFYCLPSPLPRAMLHILSLSSHWLDFNYWFCYDSNFTKEESDARSVRKEWLERDGVKLAPRTQDSKLWACDPTFHCLKKKFFQSSQVNMEFRVEENKWIEHNSLDLNDHFSVQRRFWDPKPGASPKRGTSLPPHWARGEPGALPSPHCCAQRPSLVVGLRSGKGVSHPRPLTELHCQLQALLVLQRWCNHSSCAKLCLLHISLQPTFFKVFVFQALISQLLFTHWYRSSEDVISRRRGRRQVGQVWESIWRRSRRRRSGRMARALLPLGLS